MLKVCFVVHTFDKKDRGGVLKVVSDLANNFVKNNIDVKIISFGTVTDPAFNLDPRIELLALNLAQYNTTFYNGMAKFKWFFTSYNIIKKYISEMRSSVWITSSPPISLLFSYLKYKFGLKVIGCDHTSTLYRKSVFVQWVRNKILKNINLMVALTPEDQQFYNKHGINAVYIPNSIDLSSIIPSANSRKFALYVGRFSEEKQPIKAIEIFVRSGLYKRGLKLRMYGTGYLEKDVREFINKNNYNDIVEVIINVSNPDLIYKDACVLLMTSKTEGFPMVLLEAIARNVPCISFDCPYGPRNIIINGENGYLINPNRADEFSMVLSTLSKSFDFNNLEISGSLQRFDSDIILKKWVKIIKTI
ncbi:glycosyltransferase [Acinetobacter guerrae]|uniref:Glycosyltransferase n=1 Tax=Acinetobacter guerrae TaxID=1843371 RepID=A0A3A8EGC8_9GAMM|nr:glycosyltransferase [Acinetobacter guerrae]RKG33168.1 glycosyltransferase [Acinetobacter guerrae]